MLNFDQNALKKEEPEKTDTNYFKYINKLMFLFVFIFSFIVYIVPIFKKIGNEKT